MIEKEKKKEYTRRITLANKTEIISITYEIALDYMNEAKERLVSKKEEAFNVSLRSAKKCLDALIGALDFKYEISGNLMQLYLFAKKELSCAQAKKEEKHVDNAYLVIEKLMKTWKKIEKYDESESELKNVEQVYAGLTYGKEALNESIQDPTGNRGFIA